MRPDFMAWFNCFPIPLCFDDPEARLRSHLGQDAVPTLQRGRHVLYVCPVCKWPWYKAGRREYPRLTPGQLAHLGATLHADIGALHTLPRWLCVICSTVYLDGRFTLEEYRSGSVAQCQGYQLLWESASPPRTTLVAMVLRAEPLSLMSLLQREPDILTTPVRDVRRVLAWLETRPSPTVVRVFSDAERLVLAHRLSPCLPTYLPTCLPHHRLSHLPPDEDRENQTDGRYPRHWCGYGWHETGLPSGERVLVALAITTSPLEPVPFARLLSAWRFVARALRTVL